eukprot:CAMPEP_0197519862 /NCGR_PEP_ID=MMETSP1318-20131121/5153_1 /TAXON_ID=552666 /ORGANISM="Partenskyella glossopodia, Strain RCC365" /LENGTH=122 /DNA_ID=CAMNT_0043071091 /DNA_START=108 /DNA_END=476 /DNA_ORIENTATION=+
MACAGGDTSDGIFRRPQTAIETEELPVDQELTLDDGQVPEPAFDVDPDMGAWKALLRMGIAFGLLAGAYNLIGDPLQRKACPGPAGGNEIPEEFQADMIACRYPGMPAEAPAAGEAAAQDED